MQAERKRARVKQWLRENGLRTVHPKLNVQHYNTHGWKRWSVGRWFYLYGDDADWRGQLAKWRRRHMSHRGRKTAVDYIWSAIASYPKTTEWKAWTRKDLCAYCGERLSDTVDHLVPQCDGGPTLVSNLIGACQPCNNEKGSEGLLPFLRRKRLLRPLEV